MDRWIIIVSAKMGVVVVGCGGLVTPFVFGNRGEFWFLWFSILKFRFGLGLDNERFSSFIWIPVSGIWPRPPLSVYLGRKSQSSINISFRQLAAAFRAYNFRINGRRSFQIYTFCVKRKNEIFHRVGILFWLLNKIIVCVKCQVLIFLYTNFLLHIPYKEN